MVASFGKYIVNKIKITQISCVTTVTIIFLSKFLYAFFLASGEYEKFKSFYICIFLRYYLSVARV